MSISPRKMVIGWEIKSLLDKSILSVVSFKTFFLASTWLLFNQPSDFLVACTWLYRLFRRWVGLTSWHPDILTSWHPFFFSFMVSRSDFVSIALHPYPWWLALGQRNAVVYSFLFWIIKVLSSAVPFFLGKWGLYWRKDGIGNDNWCLVLLGCKLV